MSLFAVQVQPARLLTSILAQRLRVSLLALGLSLPFLFGAVPAGAQTPIKLATLHVSLWPEYDRAAVLVILDGTLDSSVTLPASLAVRIPGRVGQPSAVATAGANGQLLTAAFTTSVAGTDTVVKFETSSSGFRIEYYDSSLITTGEARQFAFQWTSDYAIGEAVVRVQQPANARDLKGQPTLTSAGAADFGLSYYDLPVGPITAGQTISLDLSYQKADSQLSVDVVGTAAPASVAQPASVPTSSLATTPGGSSLPLILGGAAVGLALIGGGVTWYLRSARPAPAAHRPRKTSHQGRQRRPAAAKTGPSGPPRPPATARFCTQCGQALLSGDRFCRNCGSPVPAA